MIFTGRLFSAAGATLGVIAGGLIALIFLVLIFYAYRGKLRNKIRRDKTVEWRASDLFSKC